MTPENIIYTIIAIFIIVIFITMTYDNPVSELDNQEKESITLSDLPFVDPGLQSSVMSKHDHKIRKDRHKNNIAAGIRRFAKTTPGTLEMRHGIPEYNNPEEKEYWL